MRQFVRLQELCETAALVEARGDAFADGKVCVRAHRGRERRPPLEFDAEIQLFDH